VDRLFAAVLLLALSAAPTRGSKSGDIDMRLRFAARREGDRFGQFKMRYTAEARAEHRALMSLTRKL
jgi:hypothetical protein